VAFHSSVLHIRRQPRFNGESQALGCLARRKNILHGYWGTHLVNWRQGGLASAVRVSLPQLVLMLILIVMKSCMSITAKIPSFVPGDESLRAVIVAWVSTLSIFHQSATSEQ
jgi:hypothetical protein